MPTQPTTAKAKTTALYLKYGVGDSGTKALRVLGSHDQTWGQESDLLELLAVSSNDVLPLSVPRDNVAGLSPAADVTLPTSKVPSQYRA